MAKAKNDVQLIRSLDKGWIAAKIKRAGGQTNRNYIVECGKEKFFVRLPWESKVIDRRIEGKNILKLSQNKKIKMILPKYYSYILNKRNILNPDDGNVYGVPDGTTVTEFIPGKTPAPSAFKRREFRGKLARMFYVLHSSGVSFGNKYDVFRDELEKYRLAAQKLPISKILSSQSVIKLLSIEREAKKNILVARPAPTHNDFLFQNFILGNDGKIYLLDFEYAGMNERGILYDFGYFFADNVFRKPIMTKELFENFLLEAEEVYKKKFDRRQIYWLALAVPVMQIWWGVLRYFDVKSIKEKKYFQEYIEKRIKGIDYLYLLANKIGVKKP